MGLTTSNGGKIEYVTYSDSVKYAIYVPPNVSSDTNVFTYVYGSGRENDWGMVVHNNELNPAYKYGVLDALMDNNVDSIVILPTMSWHDNWGVNTMNIVDSVRKQYGIKNANMSGGGFSMGGFGGLDVVAENIKRNPEIDPQAVFFIDDYSASYYRPESKLTSENVELFKKNETLFYIYAPKSKSIQSYQKYIDAGLNLVKVEPVDAAHVAINDNFFRNGVYDYMSGKALPRDGYTYKVYNYETSTWDVVDYESISTINNIYDYYGITPKSEKLSKLFSNFFGNRFNFDMDAIDKFTDKLTIFDISSSVLEKISNGFSLIFPTSIAFLNGNLFTNMSSTLKGNSILFKMATLKNEGYAKLQNNQLNGHSIQVKPNMAFEAARYIKNIVPMQLEEMTSKVNSIYSDIVAYAAADPSVSVPSFLDPIPALRAITTANQECRKAADNIVAITDSLIAYGEGKWQENDERLSKINEFVASD